MRLMFMWRGSEMSQAAVSAMSYGESGVMPW
jgi:hypothetical protein